MATMLKVYSLKSLRSHKKKTYTIIIRDGVEYCRHLCRGLGDYDTSLLDFKFFRRILKNLSEIILLIFALRVVQN